jgi:hypothetical protein
MGSCFAVEIRKALRAQHCTVYPDYPSMEFDPASQAPGLLPERDNINHYDTFTIRQEIERAITGGRWTEGDFWSLTPPNHLRSKPWVRAYQDPYRRHIFAHDLSALVDLSDKVSACIDEGFASADVVIITLGLTECWRVKSNGRYAALGPESKEDKIFPLVEFRATGFEENYDNLRATVSAIWSAFPEKKIVFTISPVALGRTWTGEDVVQANMQSKATLRAAVGEISRRFPAVRYWPSFEYAMRGDVFKEDGRHVRDDAVRDIVTAFLEANSR